MAQNTTETYFYKIDVIGHYGYSFMVEMNDDLGDDYDEVIDRANKAGLFEDETDLHYAKVDDICTTYDIEHFKTQGCCYKI